jgi:hypothetical protein
MKDEIAKFGKMLGMFDSIFALIRGVEAGLLPTEEHTGALAQTIGGQPINQSDIFFLTDILWTRYLCFGD